MEFVDGLIAKKTTPKTPEWIKMKLSIKRQDLINWLNSKDGEWINCDIRENKEGKLYIAVNDWQKEKKDHWDKLKDELQDKLQDETDIPF